MNVFGKSFEYDGVSSSDYNVMLCSLEYSTDRTTGISYNILSGDISPNRPIRNYYNKSYKEPLQFEISICKDVCENNGTYFTSEEQKSIVRWLTSPLDYRELKIEDYDDDSYHKGICYYCLCLEYKETVINNIVCLSFTFQCNAPYAFYEEQVTSFESTESTTIQILNYSDELELYYYPIVEIIPSETGEISIVNDNFPTETMVLNVRNGQKLLIDNDMCDISDEMGLFNYNTDTNLQWIKLASGNNTIIITGKATGKIRCLYPRKVGI